MADAPISAPLTPSPLRVRLCAMMFLQYFVQGCYLPIVSVYLEEALGFTKGQIGVFGAALAIGPLFAPFLLGQLVDRRFATQHVLAVCHLTGGLTMLLLWSQQQYWPVILLGTLYSVLYVPTLMLTNSLTFHHLANGEREFPLVRVWGTIGFIVPAWLIEPLFLAGLTGEELNQARGITLLAAAVAGIGMSVYSLTLPNTPPARQTTRRFAPGAAMRLVRLRPFLVLVVISFVIGMVHQFHFTLNAPFLKDMLRRGGIEAAWEQRISSLGQIAEIGVMAVLGLMIARLGFKRTMTIGAAAYALRCLVFVLADQSLTPDWMGIAIASAGQLLHGLCFGCFLAAAYMFVDRTTPPDLRGSVQTLYGTFVLGLGFFVGGLYSGWIGDLFTTGAGKSAVVNWTGVWLSAAALAAACAAGMALLFPKTLPTVRDETNLGIDVLPADDMS